MSRAFALSNLGAGAAVAVVIFIFLLIFALSYFRFVQPGGRTMMAMGRGLLYGLVAGALWGVIAHTLAGIALTLLTGLPATPPLLAGFVAGIVGAAVFMSRPPAQRTPLLTLVSVLCNVVLVLLLVSFAQPFSVPSVGSTSLAGRCLRCVNCRQ